MTEVYTCVGADCGTKTESTLKCPVCLKQGATSVFCGQDCFKRNWGKHKFTHPKAGVDHYDPFPEYNYTGKLRPFYPLTLKRTVPENIKKPDYAATGYPESEVKEARSSQIEAMDEKELKKYRTVCKLGREVLDIAAAAVKPGVTTDEIDEIVHNETIKRKAYPSPLNYFNFPKSVCTSVNEIICHGIPDKRPLKDGDIVNLDISLYKDGFHTDLNETYYVGDKAKADPKIVNLVETTRECLQLAIDSVKPGVPFRSFGNIIEKHAHANGCQVVRTYCGHGTGRYFHCSPEVPHYAKNKASGLCKTGVVFTIEPMITAGTFRDVRWPDDWTAATADGKYTAQFEHTLLVTETGCEVLTSRFKSSPGGAVKRLN
ncbi:methionine aminopeptidase [Saccharomycopsis crataegensis]|uniref:Methionine aminopeptidase n=1 Tax=Saccharomycopsis crataegensis TaxID=43959 RepID=A0AAV5QIE5_9ASCO|nr:methionine aminopeptidase [Saccharomycopsis crataegensis]